MDLLSSTKSVYRRTLTEKVTTIIVPSGLLNLTVIVLTTSIFQPPNHRLITDIPSAVNVWRNLAPGGTNRTKNSSLSCLYPLGELNSLVNDHNNHYNKKRTVFSYRVPYVRYKEAVPSINDTINF